MSRDSNVYIVALPSPLEITLSHFSKEPAESSPAKAGGFGPTTWKINFPDIVIRSFEMLLVFFLF
jgi:hypothetical protein